MTEYVPSYSNKLPTGALDTGLRDMTGKSILVGDTLYAPISNYTYIVHFGEFTLSYTKPFPIKCKGYYVSYVEDNTEKVDSLYMLDTKNVLIS